MANEKKGFDSNSEWDTLTYLGLTKNWLLCKVREKPNKKCCIKRYSFLLQLSNKLNISSYRTFKPCHIFKR